MNEPATIIENSPKRRSLFLDGLRGCAALYVVFHHAYKEQGQPANAVFGGISGFFEFGRTAVDIFIVLSGFCLMLPIVKSPEGKLMSIGGFFGRRAWRILPPYYAAVILSMLCIELVPGMGVRRGAHWDITLPAFTPGVLLSHLLLIHNLSLAWTYKINHALWSIATECQIYVLFPLVLLPIWRRGGNVALLIVTNAAAIVMFYLFPSLIGARPWYVGLFALGMVAAALGVSRDGPARNLRDRIPWGWMTLVTLLAAATTALFRARLRQHDWLPDLLVGAVSFSLILYCVVRSSPINRNLILRLLECRPAVWLGVTSYSLYLIHPPVIAMCNLCVQRTHLPDRYHLLFMTTVGVGVSVLAGWLFHIFVEQWFIPKADPRPTSPGGAPAIVTASALVNPIK